MEIAVIKTGGKQYKITSGQKLKIEKLEGKEGDTVAFDVLLTAEITRLPAGRQGTDTRKDAEVRIGQPLVEGAKITAKILKQDRADKVTILKYKSKKRYSVKRGHRQPYSLIEIESIK